MSNTRQQAVTMMARGNGASNVTFGDSSPLLRAATVGQIRVVQELLNQLDIDIDFRDPKCYGRTALHCACKNGHLEIVKLLIEHGASIDIADSNGWTPFFEAASAQSLAVVEYMEGNGIDVNAIARDGCTILHVSAAGNSAANLEHLLQSPKLRHSLSTRSKNGRTVLLCAAEAGSVDTVRFILQRSTSAEILSKTDDGHTCLHYAAISGKPKLLSLFQDTGICHHNQTKEGLTALHYAAKGSIISMFRAVLDYIDRTTLYSQNPFANPAITEPRGTLQNHHGHWLIDDFVSGRRLNLPTRSGYTALQFLVSADPFTYDHLEMFRQLISRVSIDLERRDREKKTPLVALASRLSNDYVNSNLRLAMKELLDQGVDPNAQDISGRTAIQYDLFSHYHTICFYECLEPGYLGINPDSFPLSS